jgi:hypothetical protein
VSLLKENKTVLYLELGPVLTVLTSLAVAGNIPLSVVCGWNIHFYTEEL